MAFKREFKIEKVCKTGMKRGCNLFLMTFIVFVLGLLSACSKTNHNDDHHDLSEIKIIKVAEHVSRMGSAYIDCNKIVKC